MLFCQDHRDCGERVPAEGLSITGNRPYCEGCWAVAPWSVKAAGWVPVPGGAESGSFSKGNQTVQIKASRSERDEEGKRMLRRKFSDEDLQKLHSQKWSDRQMAAEFGCHPSLISAHRKRLGLAPNKKQSKREAERLDQAVKPRRGRKPKRETGNTVQVTVHPTVLHAGLQASVNGTIGETVNVPVALLDGIWARLNPAVKAELLGKLD